MSRLLLFCFVFVSSRIRDVETLDVSPTGFTVLASKRDFLSKIGIEVVHDLLVGFLWLGAPMMLESQLTPTVQAEEAAGGPIILSHLVFFGYLLFHLTISSR